MGRHVQPTLKIGRWKAFKFPPTNQTKLIDSLVRTLDGTFCLLNHHLYVEAANDATLLKLQGFVRVGETRIGLTVEEEPLVETDLIQHQQSLKLRDQMAWLRSRLRDHHTDHHFIVRGRTIQNHHYISIEAQMPLARMLSPNYQMQFTDIGNHWCRYMIIKGFSQEGKAIFDSISDNLLPFDWQRGKTHFVFGAPGIPHLRLTVEAPLAVWEDTIEPHLPRLPRTLTWNRRYIHVFSDQDEEWLRSQIGDHIIEYDRQFSGSMFRN